MCGDPWCFVQQYPREDRDLDEHCRVDTCRLDGRETPKRKVPQGKRRRRVDYSQPRDDEPCPKCTGRIPSMANPTMTRTPAPTASETGLDDTSYVPCELLRSIDRERYVCRRGAVDSDTSHRIATMVRTPLNSSHPIEVAPTDGRSTDSQQPPAIRPAQLAAVSVSPWGTVVRSRCVRVRLAVTTGEVVPGGMV